MNGKVFASLVLVAGIMLASFEGPAPAKPVAMQFVQEIESIQLPEGQEWFTVLVTSEATGNQVEQWFESDPKLKELREKTEWRHYDSKSPVFQSLLRPAYGNDYPILVVQDIGGAMRAQFGGTQLRAMSGPGELVKALDEAARTLKPLQEHSQGQFIRRPWRQPDCPDGQCPAPQPNPQPVNVPEPAPQTVAPVSETPWADWAMKTFGSAAIGSLLSGNPMFAGAALGGVALAYLVKQRRTNRKQPRRKGR